MSLLLWLRLAERRCGPDVNPLSSLGLVIMAGVVGVGVLIEWLQDWRMLCAGISSRPAPGARRSDRQEGSQARARTKSHEAGSTRTPADVVRGRPAFWVPRR